MKKSIIGFLILAAFISAAALTSLSAQTVKVGTSIWPPYYYEDAQKQPKGLFVEFLNEIKKRTKMDIQMVNLPTNRMLQGFRDKTIDAETFVNAAWRGDDKDISVYTMPIMESADVVLMPKSKLINGKSVDDFAGKRIGTNLGYYYGEGFSDGFDAKKMIRDDSNGSESLVQKLQLGRVDAIIMDRLEAQYTLKKMGYDPTLFAVAYTYKQTSALALRLHKSRADLLPKLDAAIKAMKDDGFVNKVIDSYLK